jgi:hypothetical protein
VPTSVSYDTFDIVIGNSSGGSTTPAVNLYSDASCGTLISPTASDQYEKYYTNYAVGAGTSWSFWVNSASAEQTYIRFEDGSNQPVLVYYDFTNLAISFTSSFTNTLVSGGFTFPSASPTPTLMEAAGSGTFAVSGGSPPYQVSLTGGHSDTISNGGSSGTNLSNVGQGTTLTYTAPTGASSTEYSMIQVTDSVGASATSTVIIPGPPAALAAFLPETSLAESSCMNFSVAVVDSVGYPTVLPAAQYAYVDNLGVNSCGDVYVGTGCSGTGLNTSSGSSADFSYNGGTTIDGSQSTISTFFNLSFKSTATCNLSTVDFPKMCNTAANGAWCSTGADPIISTLSVP